MMSERVLCASPNWYSSRCSDVNRSGVMGFGAKNTVYLLRVTPHSVSLTGELSGHTERVSGFAFCPHEGLEHLGVSSSDDKTVKIWDTGLKTVLTEHTAHQSTITSVHWSPVDKGLVVSGDEKGIVVCFWYGRNDTHSFFPEPRTIFCLACSPHRENHVAVGYKDGMIVLIDISKKGEVIHRLRGHDEEIHGLAWCPEPGEEHLYTRTEETSANTSNGLTEMEGGGYLASGSRDQTVRIWSTARGKGVMTLKLPFLKKRGAGVDPGVKERLWLTVHWPKRRPSQVVSSCFGGELVAWDLTKSGKQKWTLLGSSTDGQNHSRIVFNLSSVHVGDRELLISTSMDREIKCWDLESLECCWTLPTLGGFVYSMSFSPVGTGCLALGVGDNMIRVWNTLSVHNPFDMKTYWQNIKSKVTALAWHPVKEGCLAFGTDDGKVGVYEVYSNKPPQISSTYHRRTVYSLDWGPPIPPLSFGSGNKPSYSLYSCGGEGIIYQHDPWKLSGEANNVDKLIRDTNNIKHKLSPHTDLSWKPDGKVLAVGNEDGSIEVYGAPSLKLLCSVQQHHKIINALRWHHQHSDQTELHCLLASGSSNAIIYVHDLRSAIDNPSESPVLLTEAFRTLSGHTNKITSLSWSPHHDARLVTVSYDGTAQVWDVLKEEPLCNYRGHGGRLLCVQWSPVDPDLVWTGGDDFTIHEWAVSKQEHVRPPKSKRRVELEKKKVPQKKTKKKKKAAGKGGVKTEGNESPMGEEERGGSGADEAQSEEEEEDEDRESTVSAVTHSTGSSKEASADRCTAEKVQNGGRSFLTVKKEVKEEKKKDKPELSLKKRKPRSMLPLSTSMDHRPKEELQQDCLTLAAVKHSHDESVNCVPGSGEHLHLGLFTDREALCRMFQEEEESHVEAGHYDSVVYLRLWKGDLTGALHVATEKGELTDHLLSLAPMAGFQVWSKAVEAYVKQLCLQEQFLKAASHLVSIHKIYEAISLLKGHQLYREAIALAKARLQPDDPVLKDLYMSWAAVLEKDGHYTTAAKCYLAAGSSFDAAKVIAKKGDVMSLKTAANLARLAGECDLSHSLSLRCAKELMLSQDWLAAQDILRTQDTLLGHQLVLCVNELLAQRLSLTASVSWSSASSHAWSKPTEEDFLPAVQRVWQSEFGLATADLSQITTLHQQLRAIESPPATASMPIKQLLSQVALDVAVSVVSQLLGDWGSAVEGLLRAVARGFEVGHFSLMAEMCQLLLPQGLDSIALCKQRLVEDDERSLFASQSLEAFVCYRHLYSEWWRLSCSSTTAASSIQQTNGLQTSVENGGDTSHERENGSLSEAHGVQAMLRFDGFWKVLLSEPHANLQATQRAIRDVQGRVANLVEQHSRQQVPPPSLGTQPQTPSTEPDSSDVPADLDNKQRPSVADTMSLTALAAQTTELQKKLAALPDSLKKYSFPDVVECCIILLYLEKYSGMIPRHLCETAMGLLLKYGTTGSLHKAWQRFTL